MKKPTVLPFEFTPIPNEVIDALITGKFKKREKDVLMLIIRATYGCLNSRWATLIMADFAAARVPQSHIKSTLIPLIESGCVSVNKRTKQFRINIKGLRARARPNVDRKKRLKKVLGKNLPRKGSQKRKYHVSKKVTLSSQIEEASNTVIMDTYSLPKSEAHLSVSSTDLLSIDNASKIKTKNSQMADSDKKSTLKSAQIFDAINPETFKPKSQSEYTALQAFNTLGDRPSSFAYYLMAAKTLPFNIIDEIIGEIKDDDEIINKGSMFVSKVEYYRERFRETGSYD